MTWLDPALLILFAIHLVAFLVLLIKRRTLYHGLLVLLFGFLVASFSLKIWAPELVWNAYPAFQWLRWAAWAMAAITLPWLAIRLFRRIRRTKSSKNTPSTS